MRYPLPVESKNLTHYLTIIWTRCKAALNWYVSLIGKEVAYGLSIGTNINDIDLEYVGWNYGGRMASAESGSVLSGVGYGDGVSHPQQTRGYGERRELPQRGPRRSPGRKRILAILKVTERSFLYLHDKILGDNLHYRPPTPNSGWGLVSPRPPRDVRPCLNSRSALSLR